MFINVRLGPQSPTRSTRSVKSSTSAAGLDFARASLCCPSLPSSIVVVLLVHLTLTLVIAFEIVEFSPPSRLELAQLVQPLWPDQSTQLFDSGIARALPKQISNMMMTGFVVVVVIRCEPKAFVVEIMFGLSDEFEVDQNPRATRSNAVQERIERSDR